MDFLWTHPFRELTVGELMSRAGSSRSAFYPYFTDLHELMETLLLGLKQDILEAAAFWFQGEGDPLPHLQESLKGLVQVSYERGPILRAVSDAAAIGVVGAGDSGSQKNREDKLENDRSRSHCSVFSRESGGSYDTNT